MATVNRNTKLSTAARLLAVLMGALLTGMAWRIRGDHGFGGTWGMLAVSTTLILFLLFIFPKKDKMSLEFFAVFAFMSAITAGGWGTINSQITGTLTSTAEFTGETAARIIEISPVSGIITMLMLGFGWMPFFGFFLGQYFSDKRYSVFRCVEGIAVYYAAKNIFKFTLAPLLYKLVCPQAVSLFEDGLADRNIAKTPFAFYASALGNLAKGKKIPGGRNYFTCVATVAGVLAAVTLILWIALRFKDKRCAGIALGSCGCMALAITAADVFMLLGDKPNAPQWLSENSWPLWEYFTGFLFGALIVAFLFCINKSDAENVKCFSAQKLPKPLRLAVGFASFFMAFCITPIVAAGGRMDSTAYLKNGEAATLPVYIATAVLAAAIAAALTVKNMVKNGKLSPIGNSIESAAKAACPMLLAVFVLLYFFTAASYAVYPPLSVVTNIMIFSVAGFYAGYAVLIKKVR